MLELIVRASRRDRGLTLVELLVVISIIALLISILLPSLQKARETARSVKCASNMKQFATANNMYADEEDGYLVPIRTAHPNGSTWIRNEKFRRIMDWRPSGDVPHEIRCPTRPDIYAQPQQWGIGYGFNRSRLWHLMSYSDLNVVHRNSVRWKPEKTQLGERNYWRDTVGDADFNTKWDVFGETMPAEGGTYPTIAYRHNETAHWQFFDAHVEPLSKEASRHEEDPVRRERMHFVCRDR